MISEIENSVAYLSSAAALQMVAADPYWPKWNSPWWHMSLLHEMGETHRIPQSIIESFVASLNRYPLKLFPIHSHEMPEGVDPFRGTPCHCQLGNVYQVLAARGVDVDQELPWIRPWFLRYQMPDGGFNCDNDAYLVKDETPSSMVGTISAFEAVLLYTDRKWTPEEERFLEKAAQFLMSRKLMLGSSTKHNASERESAKEWVKLCFPRFYLYDVLRGLNALSLWAEKTKNTIPEESVRNAISYLSENFPDGNLRCGRYAIEGAGTLMPADDGSWVRGQKATDFSLLQKVSKVGEVSPFLSRQWAECRRRLEI